MIGVCERCTNYIKYKIKYKTVYKNGGESGLYEVVKEHCKYGLDLTTNCGEIYIDECNQYDIKR
jgi:hypothetical protein